MRHGEAGTSSYNELEMICPSKYGRLMMTSINKKQTTIEDGFLGGADKRVFSCDMAVPKLQVLPNFSHQNKIKNPGRKRWVSKEDRNLRQTRSTSVPPLSLPLTEVSGDSGQHGHATALTMSSPPQSGILSPEQYIINQKIKRRKSLEQNRRSSDLGADVDIDNPGIFEVGQSIDVVGLYSTSPWRLSKQPSPNATGISANSTSGKEWARTRDLIVTESGP